MFQTITYTEVHEEGTPQTEQSLGYEEKNAIRYTAAAGYMPRALKKKTDRSTHPLQKELPAGPY